MNKPAADPVRLIRLPISDRRYSCRLSFPTVYFGIDWPLSLALFRHRGLAARVRIGQFAIAKLALLLQQQATAIDRHRTALHIFFFGSKVIDWARIGPSACAGRAPGSAWTVPSGSWLWTQAAMARHPNAAPERGSAATLPVTGWCRE